MIFFTNSRWTNLFMAHGENFEKNSRYTTTSALPNPSFLFTSDEPDFKIYRILNMTFYQIFRKNITFPQTRDGRIFLWLPGKNSKKIHVILQYQLYRIQVLFSPQVSRILRYIAFEIGPSKFKNGCLSAIFPPYLNIYGQ